MRGNTIIIIIFIHLQQERERENNKEIVFYCIAPPVAGAPDPEMNEFFVLLFYSCPVDSLVLINRVLEMRAKRSKKITREMLVIFLRSAGAVLDGKCSPFVWWTLLVYSFVSVLALLIEFALSLNLCLCGLLSGCHDLRMVECDNFTCE